MIEAHVINAANRHLYERQWDEFLRKRFDFFVREKKWRPPSADGLETDQFDTDAATYLLGIEDGQVVTSARLIPTSEPHLVSEIFPHMCERFGVPRRPDWAEWTRTFVVPQKRSFGRRGTLTELCCAVMEYALEEGVTAVGGTQELYFMQHHRALGWKANPMGLARKVNQEWYIVAYVDVDEEALERVRRILGINHSLLVRRGAQRPFIDEPQPIVLTA
jgi:acyl-homoserine lactone synthase